MLNYSKRREEFPEEHPDVLPSDATYQAIIGFLMSQLGHKAIQITARTLREWRLKGVKVVMQRNGNAILTDGSQVDECATSKPARLT